MLNDDPFLYAGLTADDQINFIKAFQMGLARFGENSCWCMKDKVLNQACFDNFMTNKKNHLTYKNRDARPLMLSITKRFSSEHKPIIVRKGICKTKYCLNPAHYYWGTRADVAKENAIRNRKGITPELIIRLRQEKEDGISSLKLSKIYNLQYETVRRICNNETYETIDLIQETDNLKEIWNNVLFTYQKLMKGNPEAGKKIKSRYLEAGISECPWHQKNTTKHKGNFGRMKECLDCMEEVKKGRCTIDVGNFDFRWYWQIKRFWEQVDIGSEEECWPWMGATKKNGTESTAYFPSPFHSAKTQSAPRVAFWLSRGYTGRYRIFSKKTCKPFCCNPLHLTIKDLKDYDPPTKLKCTKLTHDNIFKHYKERENNTKKK